MFKIDEDNQKIIRLKDKNLSDKFRERQHLQEWIADTPDCLGEELLIIQKEFQNWDDTNERFDLLALDKDGCLVIIEIKLDDSGKDVTWQALKYVSYCSTLTREQIIEMYQNYLDENNNNEDEDEDEDKGAEDKIRHFLENVEESDETQLNRENSQRIMLVASNFKKEVTSTVLWLLNNNIQIQCFKLTLFENEHDLFENEHDLFLDIEQIIPTPETEDFRIKMNEKKLEEKNIAKKERHSHNIRRRFWQKALEEMKKSQCGLYDDINPTNAPWLNAGSGIRGCPYRLHFRQKSASVDFNVATSEKEENKRIFDLLEKQKNNINSSFGDELNWLRLEDQKSCRIEFSKEFDGYNEENWEEIIKWLIDHMIKLENALKEPLNGVK